MKLLRYRVFDFKSVKDSGWIDANDVTALIGVNESGKTNLLLPLWKLNPAKEGELRPTEDYPKKLFGDIRKEPGKYRFIQAEFATGEHAEEISNLTGLPIDAVDKVSISRSYDGAHVVSYPSHVSTTTVPAETISSLLRSTIENLRNAPSLKGEGDLGARLIASLEGELARLGSNAVSALAIRALEHRCRELPSSTLKTSSLTPLVAQLVDRLEEHVTELSRPGPETVEAARAYVLSTIPKFVYYSNYGNLDSEIYLPHVVENLKRTNLGAKEEAKARTLKVLFGFVGLQPQEILELGRDFKDPNDPNRKPTDAEIEVVAKKKKERSILLQSAHTKLTQRFREWWKQGDYRFRFEADGNHFRIWVADDRRPEEVELEGRSTGLQWFLSFYLVFLFESEDAHANTFLLLDEPGLSLHPLAQRDLSNFFDNLSEANQVIYTTHSPFLVDADHLDRARKVYVADDGTTVATADLRAGGSADKRQAAAAYAVHSALNMTVAESLLLGCQPVIVEGASDQMYLTAIKTLLIGGKKISPSRELVFPPSGGAKGIRPIAGILTGRDEELPLVLLDGDPMGRKHLAELKTSLYKAEPEKLLCVSDFTGIEEAEGEDLIPSKFLAAVVDRYLRSEDVAFADVVQEGLPIVGQIESWAADQTLDLPEHWKVELAKRCKQRMLDVGLQGFDDESVAKWVTLFKKLSSKPAKSGG